MATYILPCSYLSPWCGPRLTRDQTRGIFLESLVPMKNKLHANHDACPPEPCLIDYSCCRRSWRRLWHRVSSPCSMFSLSSISAKHGSTQMTSTGERQPLLPQGCLHGRYLNRHVDCSHGSAQACTVATSLSCTLPACVQVHAAQRRRSGLTALFDLDEGLLCWQAAATGGNHLPFQPAAVGRDPRQVSLQHAAGSACTAR